MTIARSGGANLLAASGAIMSGIYVGERLSPASSAAAVAAAVAGVDDRAFRSRMWRDTLLPFSITLLLYGVLAIHIITINGTARVNLFRVRC